MSQTKTTLYELAEAAGHQAFTAQGYLDRWSRDHPGEPLPPTHQWVIDARVWNTAYLTLSLMALDEEASRKFIASLMGRDDAKMLVAMLSPARPKAESKAA